MCVLNGPPASWSERNGLDLRMLVVIQILDYSGIEVAGPLVRDVAGEVLRLVHHDDRLADLPAELAIAT